MLTAAEDGLFQDYINVLPYFHVPYAALCFQALNQQKAQAGQTLWNAACQPVPVYLQV